MARLSLIPSLLLLLLPCSGPAQAPAPANGFLLMPGDLVPLNSPDGKRLFRQSTANEAFWSLSQYYVTQPDLGSCSVASSVMVLNALGIERPVSKSHGAFHLFTPDNFFTPAVEAIRPRASVSAEGMSLDQLARVLGTFPVTVTETRAGPDGLADFRELLKTTLARDDRFVIINYLRKALGQQSGGHISPLAAYHAGEDAALVLDVSNYKYPWTWVKLPELWQAMAVVDADSGLGRGYVVVAAKPKSAAETKP